MIENKGLKKYILENTDNNKKAVLFCRTESWRTLGGPVGFSGGTEGNQSLLKNFKRGTMKY